MAKIDKRCLLIVILVIIITVLCWSRIEGFGMNITDALSTGNEKELVLFYSKKCPHSIEMESTWHMFVEAHKNDAQKMRMEKVDADQTNAPIPILPVIRAYQGGKIIGELEGNQSYDALDAFYLQLSRFIF